MYDNYLIHHGVKGMKWGVRHDKPSSGRTSRKERLNNLKNSKPKYESFSDRPISGRSARKQRVNENLKTTTKSPAEKKKAKQRRAEKRKTNLSKMRNYTGSRTSDALKRARKNDINKMSNADLQKNITRLNLERQYRDLTRVDLKPGKQYVDSARWGGKTVTWAKGSSAYKAGKSVAFTKGAKTAAKIATL